MFAALLLSSQLALAQFTQQGPKLVGTGAVGTALQGYFVALSADGNTAIVGGPGDNSHIGAAWVFELNRRLSFVLEERARMRLPTVAFVQDVQSFERFRSLFTLAYREVNIAKSTAPALNPPTSQTPSPGKPNSSLAEVVKRWVRLRREYD
jgi:hypothetical protein